MLRPGTLALTTLLAMVSALGPLSMDMYLPSLPDIAHVLQAPTARVQLTVSSYLIGFAVGQVIYGPVSDRHGRRPVLLAAVALYLISTLVCAATPSVTPLIGARFLQGIGGSGSIVLARAVVRDLYSGVQAARELSLMGSISAFAPIVAPMIGGVLQTAFGWRASFIAMAAFAVVALVVAGRLLPETLRQRARQPISLSSVVGGYGAVLRHRGFLVYLGILTISYAGLFAWISGASVVLQGIYGLSAVAFGFTFALGAAGYMLGATVATRLVVRLGLDRTMGLGVMVLAAGGLALAAVVAAGIPGVWLVAAMAIYLAGLGLSMPQAMAGALTPFPDRAGTAASLMGLVQQTVAAVVAAIVGDYLGRSAWPVAGVVVAMGCLTLLLWAFTRRIRAQER
ncbi:MAG: multidrug effflux MFS transporter [Xanthobacteraceae bacterium]|jgi:DHA1 family bicyclomycin/chloramphenicol resistance-like MFS transporter